MKALKNMTRKELLKEFDRRVAARKAEERERLEKNQIDLTPAMTPEEIADYETDIIKPAPFPSAKRPFEDAVKQLMEINPILIKVDSPALNLAAQIMGKKGGKSKSPAKIAAVRENGKKGGRPRKFTAGGETQTGATWPTREFTEKDLPF